MTLKTLFTRAIFTLLLLVHLAPPANAANMVKHYLQKYSKLKVSTSQREKLAEYDHLIEYFCSFAFFEANHKVNPDFLRALILAESAANAKALSHKAARGLTQIIYPTGKLAARELAKRNMAFRYVTQKDLTDLQEEDLYNPAVNILLACYLISKYNYNFDGRLDLVVSAWNAGAGSIVDNSPPSYQETQDLIGKVNGYYIALLQEPPKPTKYAYRR